MTFEYETLLEPIAATAAHHAADVDRGQFPTQTLRALGDAGLLGLVSAAEVGGKGLGLTAAAAVVERLARECGSTGMVVCMHYCATTSSARSRAACRCSDHERARPRRRGLRCEGRPDLGWLLPNCATPSSSS